MSPNLVTLVPTTPPKKKNPTHFSLYFPSKHLTYVNLSEFSLASFPNTKSLNFNTGHAMMIFDT